MKTEGISSGGNVFDNFDEVDIMMMVDKNLDDALDRVEKDTIDGIYDEAYIEATSMTNMIDNYEDKLVVPTDPVATRPDPIEDAASEYIDAYHDINGVLDVGDIIDIIAGTV